jgi:hypothetical protein
MGFPNNVVVAYRALSTLLTKEVEGKHQKVVSHNTGMQEGR